MDDLDDFFGDDAVDAFVNGIKFDVNTSDPSMYAALGGDHNKQDKLEFASALIENDELLLGALLGDGKDPASFTEMSRG